MKFSFGTSLYLMNAFFVSKAFVALRNPTFLIARHSISTTTTLLSSSSSNQDTVVSRCTQKITDALQPTRLKVSAAHDDPNGSHIAIECVSTMFEGKALVMRQRLIYKAIWDEMADGGSVHAVDKIIAKTPAEDKT